MRWIQSAPLIAGLAAGCGSPTDRDPDQDAGPGAVGFEGTAAFSLLNSTDLRFAAVVHECADLIGGAAGFFDPGESHALFCSDGMPEGDDNILAGPPSENYTSIEVYDLVGELMYEQRPIDDALWQVREQDGGEIEIVLELFSDDVDRRNAGLCCCSYDNFMTVEILEIEECEAIADGACETTFPPSCPVTALGRAEGPGVAEPGAAR